MLPESIKKFSAKHSNEITDTKLVEKQLELALASVAQHDFSAADTGFKKMLDMGARSPYALNHYAIYLREQWRIDEAETIYLKALQFSPSNAMTHWNIAVLYELYRGDFELALQHYRQYKTFALTPDSRINGWIADLERRLQAAQAKANTGDNK